MFHTDDNTVHQAPRDRCQVVCQSTMSSSSISNTKHGNSKIVSGSMGQTDRILVFTPDRRTISPRSVLMKLPLLFREIEKEQLGADTRKELTKRLAKLTASPSKLMQQFKISSPLKGSKMRDYLGQRYHLYSSAFQSIILPDVSP